MKGKGKKTKQYFLPPLPFWNECGSRGKIGSQRRLRELVTREGSEKKWMKRGERERGGKVRYN